MNTPIRPDPERAERNLRNAVKLYTPASVQVYGQDVVDILDALDALRRERDQYQAAAVTALEQADPAHPRTMKAAGLVLAGLLLLLLPALASAQPVQVGPTLAVTFHAGSNYSCAGVEVEQWTLVYGERCNADPPVVLVPFIATVLVRLTPMTQPPTPPAADPNRPAVVRSVPRASVYRTTDPASCAPTKAPCLSVRVPSVPGLQLVDVALVAADGSQTDWLPLGLAVEGRITASPVSEGRVRP
jgi:hypothetical protein